jgi:predicted chitinase
MRAFHLKYVINDLSVIFSAFPNVAKRDNAAAANAFAASVADADHANARRADGTDETFNSRGRTTIKLHGGERIYANSQRADRRDGSQDFLYGLHFGRHDEPKKSPANVFV